MLRGTRIIEGEEAYLYQKTIDILRRFCLRLDFEEIIVPQIWNEETFTDKVGEENSNMMWRFKDRKDRSVCLIPEVTGLIQEQWRDGWRKRYGKRNIFYVSKCYRYERPQKGRYREFTQFGIEMLGQPNSSDICKNLLDDALVDCGVKFEMQDGVSRGLSYYTGDGFEASVSALGAQKQIAGGGAYPEGAGWAIGIDRTVMAILQQQVPFD